MSVLAFVKEYIADRTASMATQVVMFSVLLFGTSGVVLDFGRIYSEHSIMQSYTDQAALAAAAELTLEPGSIDRAVDAVFGGVDGEGNALASPISRDAVFSSGTQQGFGVSHLIFLSELGQDSGAQSSMAGIQDGIVYVAFSDGSSSGDAATAAREARYVIAVAEERSVRNTLIQLINSGTDAPSAASNVVRTVSAATRQAQFCGEFSNLVMCSREADMSDDLPLGATPADLGEFMNEFPGVRFAHIADNTGGTENYRLYRRTNPTMKSLTAVEELCADEYRRPGGQTGSTLKQEEYQAICHLAAATPRDHCIGDQITIIQAEPEVITTALSTAFDMYDYPMNEVLNWPGTAEEGNMVNFQPDLLVYKGKTPTATPVAGEPASSRRNYDETLPFSSYIDLMLPQCMFYPSGYSGCSIGSHIGPASDRTALTEYYVTNYFTHFLAYNFPAGLPAGITSFYLASLQERYEWTHAIDSRMYFDVTTGQPGSVTAGQSLAATGEDASSADRTPDPEQAFHEDLSTSETENYSNYNSTLYPVDYNNANDRRRITVPLVDCSNMTYDNDTGGYNVDVLTFVDVYLLHPPLPECGNGTENCNNAELVKSTIFTEMIEKSDYTETNFPELVR